ncbi:MAG: alpha/beta hydrolase [Methylohalobius crimeensis]
MTERLDAVVLETGPEPDACILWLHGLGADGYDFEPIAYELRLPGAIRYVFPHAPTRPVTINGGMEMRAWYDIFSPDLQGQVDKPGIDDSRDLIDVLIDDQVAAGIDPGRIVLAGFSQGGVIALETGVRRHPSVAGIVALSTYVALPGALPEAGSDAFPPILMMHGSQDTVVPLPVAERSRLQLVRKGYPVEWHVFSMPHSVCAEEIVILRRWLTARLGYA